MRAPPGQKHGSPGLMTRCRMEPCDYMEGDRQESGGYVPSASWEISQQHKNIRAQLSHGSWLSEPALHEKLYHTGELLA